MERVGIHISGGAIHGAWEAGVLAGIAQHIQDMEIAYVCGISAGALNGGVLCSLAGLEPGLGYKKLAEMVCDLWTKRVTGPSDVLEKKKKFKLAIDALRGKYDGYVGSEGLRELISSLVSPGALRDSRYNLEVGFVPFGTREIVYYTGQQLYIVEAIMASASIPVIMPPTDVAGSPCFDGGLVDVVPVGDMINKYKPDKVVIINTHSPASTKEHFGDPTNIVDLITWVVGVYRSNTMENDVKTIMSYNRLLADNAIENKDNRELRDKKIIDVMHVQPHMPLHYDMLNFDTDDIESMINMGFYAGMRGQFKRFKSE